MSVTKSGRVDVVFIRKSTAGQMEEGQIDNVRNELRAIPAGPVTVPDEYWFVGTVGRRKVQTDPEFKRLMSLVEADQVGTVYIESQDRWGTKDRGELYALLDRLHQHDTRLYDLKGKRDLTDMDDLASELLTFLGSVKSQTELKDLAYRSLRTRVNNFQQTGTWPTGMHPYGFGKACYAPDGRLRWVWHSLTRTHGKLYYADPTAPDGLTIPVGNATLPRKQKGDKTVLVPCEIKESTCNVQFVFDLFTRLGLSRRQISARMNAEGRRFYERPWTHSLVTQILTNPAYVGDTHFGRTQTGEMQTFDKDGRMVALKKPTGKTRVRDVAERLVKSKTHEGLIDRKTWDAAQAKISAEKSRASFSPRNPEYYLKQLFVCGHCGKNLTGRTERDHVTKQKRVVYVCQTWMQGKCSGQVTACGYQRITHEEAEQLLLERIKKLNVECDVMVSAGARANIKARLERLGVDDDAARERWWQSVQDGVRGLLAYLKDAFDLDPKALRRLDKLALKFYSWKSVRSEQLEGLPLAVEDFTAAVSEAESLAVATAHERFAACREVHKKVTQAWARASNEQEAILKEECNRLEAEMVLWRERTTPLGERLKRMSADDDERRAERDRMIAEWPVLQSRERGEALRRIFQTVTLFWDREFRPASTSPSRPRKTDRPGRWKSTLRRDKILWALAVTDLGGSR